MFLRKNAVFNSVMWKPVKHIWKHIALVLLAGVIVVITYMIGCSHTSFEDMGALCDAVEDRNGTCTPIHLSDDPVLPDDPDPADPSDPSDPPSLTDPSPAGPRTSRVETTYTVRLGQVDIIFVIDNSGSMSREHKNLGKQMKSFLRRIKNLDYRLAVITTDISASPGNPNRGQSFQDGNFIKVGGKDWLENTRIGESPGTGGVAAFLSALIRPETKRCDEQRESGSDSDPCGECISRYGESDRCDTLCDGSSSSGGGQCVSSDERGIYALNLALEKHPDFHRPDAHLMVVILSDEDERSSEEWMETNGYDLEDKDRPLTLVETVYHRLGGFKTFSVHAIIIPPGSAGDRCLDEQNRDQRAGGRGYKGEQYARLARASEPELMQYGNLLTGKIISICDRSYAGQLEQVEVYANAPRVSIGCANPLRVRFFQNGRKLDLSYEVEEGTKSLVITDSLSISSHLDIKVVCEVAL